MLLDPTRGNPERKLLMRAAEKIEQYGWGRGDLIDDKKRPCVLGGIKLALEESRERVEYHAALWLLKRAICRKMGKVMYVVDWNDAYCRDAADAASMLRRAAMEVE